MSQVPQGSDWDYVDPDDDVATADAYTQATQPTASRGEVAPYDKNETDEVRRTREKEEKLLRRRARKKVMAKNALKSHLVAYAAVMAMLWVIYLVTDPGGTPWPIFPMLGWGVGVASHVAATRQLLTQDDEIEREVQQLRRQIGS